MELENKKVLHLPMKRKWFYKFLNGKKRNDYREAKKYWDSRLKSKKYDVVLVRNGYKKNSPYFFAECGKICRVNNYYHKDSKKVCNCYVIQIKKIVEFGNINRRLCRIK